MNRRVGENFSYSIFGIKHINFSYICVRRVLRAFALPGQAVLTYMEAVCDEEMDKR